MNHALTIARRELSAQFFSATAYLVLAIFAFIAALLFIGMFTSGAEASMRQLYTWIVWLLVFVAPAISMRLISEESRSGAIELLMTAPVTDTQVVMGKWLGAMGFFLAMLVPLIVLIVALEIAASPDYGPIVTGLIGLILVGGLYLAIGVFVSAFTDSQLIAFMITVLITGFLTIGMYMLATADAIPIEVKDAMSYINVDQQYSAFAKGLIDIRNFVYFLTAIGLFLFLGVKALESRRWR